MNLRILIVGACPYPVPQGSQVFMRDHALALAARGHDVQLLVYGHGQGDDDSGLPLHRAPVMPGFRRVKAGPSWAKPLLDLGLTWKLRRVNRQVRPDVVIAHNYEALLAALTAGARPLVYHAHNAMRDELPYYFHQWRLMTRAGAWLDNALPRRADRCIVPHQRLADYLHVEGGVLVERLHIVPPPVDVADFAVPQYTEGPADILYTGNLDSYQNLPLLYRAMERVHAMRPEIRLHIATHQATIQAPRQPYIALQHVPNFAAMRSFLARDGVFALPRVSWSGYPVKLLNALAAGRPVVACESVAHGLEQEVNALVCPDNDVAAFAKALLRLTGDAALRHEIGVNARRRVAEEHSFQEVGQRLEAVLREVCHR